MDNLHSRETAQNYSPLRNLLSRLFDGWSVGAGKAPTIYGDNAVPTEGPMNDSNLPDLSLDGPMNDQNLPNLAPARRRMAAASAPSPVNPGMPVTEGQNANIDDVTRANALAYIQALRNGGALG
jgi:hypothetical protein